jgi:hypothetical protein
LSAPCRYFRYPGDTLIDLASTATRTDPTLMETSISATCSFLPPGGWCHSFFEGSKAREWVSSSPKYSSSLSSRSFETRLRGSSVKTIDLCGGC